MGWMMKQQNDEFWESLLKKITKKQYDVKNLVWGHHMLQLRHNPLNLCFEIVERNNSQFL